MSQENVQTSGEINSTLDPTLLKQTQFHKKMSSNSLSPSLLKRERKSGQCQSVISNFGSRRGVSLSMYFQNNITQWAKNGKIVQYKSCA